MSPQAPRLCGLRSVVLLGKAALIHDTGWLGLTEQRFQLLLGCVAFDDRNHLSNMVGQLIILNANHQSGSIWTILMVLVYQRNVLDNANAVTS